MNLTQGDTWYLTVQRTISEQNYTVRAYVDRVYLMSFLLLLLLLLLVDIVSVIGVVGIVGIEL